MLKRKKGKKSKRGSVELLKDESGVYKVLSNAKVTVTAVKIKKDGTREDLGTIFESDPKKGKEKVNGCSG